MALFVLNKLNINIAMRTLLLSYSLTLNSSIKKTSEAYRLLLIVFKVSLEETYSIS